MDEALLKWLGIAFAATVFIGGAAAVFVVAFKGKSREEWQSLALSRLEGKNEAEAKCKTLTARLGEVETELRTVTRELDRRKQFNDEDTKTIRELGAENEGLRKKLEGKS